MRVLDKDPMSGMIRELNLWSEDWPMVTGSANRENGAAASEACVRANGEGDRGLELQYAARWCDNLTGIDVEANPTRTV